MEIISGNHHHHHHLRLHLHIPRVLNFHQKNKNIPKGYLTLMVGQREEQQKLVIPLFYVNHPLFMQLLKKAEEEYGFNQKGVFTIPCKIEEFRDVQRKIDMEKSHHHHHHHHHHHAWCFKV